MWTAPFEPYLPAVYGVAGMIALLVLTAFLWQLAWRQRAKTDGMPLVLVLLGALPLLGVLYMLKWAHIDLLKGAVGIMVGLSIIFGGGSRRPSYRRRRY